MMLNHHKQKRYVMALLLSSLLLGLAFETGAQDAAEPAPAQPAAQPAAAPNAPAANNADEGEPQKYSLLQLMSKGGILMIPIAICSVIALGVAVERFISLQRSRIIPQGFLTQLRAALGPQQRDLDAGRRYCMESKSIVGSIFYSGIARLPHGHDAVEKAIEDAGAREVGKLKRSLLPLSAIATIAPLLGLLGTVYGMIGAFQAASAAGVGKGDTLARGIYEALVTTATGLSLAIPVLIIYLYLNGKVNSLVDDIDESAIEFLEDTLRIQRGERPDHAPEELERPPAGAQLSPA
ncbi:MAG: MotA/TolQ/ExbB proton channel family protein [Rhodospirillales bacterium]|nr:MotA/TolQ/ExbB proton channel family protein [Rhodospirillales bacterium]